MLTWILGILAAVCLLYYIIIVLYSGFATSFSAVWLLMAVSFFFILAGREYYRHNRDKVLLWVPVSIVTVICTGIVVFAIVETMVFMGAASGDVKNLDYLIVLGARVKEEGISKSLKMRLDKAIQYTEQNPDTILILSGGKGKDEPVSEAVAMKEYLLFNGVSKDRMILEPNSESTVENVAYSRLLIEADWKTRRQMRPSRDRELQEQAAIGVLTSNFHVFRAKQIAKKWGIPDIYGISCDSDPVLFLHFSVREFAAILKDKLMGNM